ncbi:MAG: cystathionine gamma-synthase [Candidatus Eremiobacter antarcticus]|nr:cystathionine gamma-synthase [Candidatus Eremiobacteraeota bacterium]MBC5808287.1 cystathionine gamma-synthase [Candidatus Eremiobacteraeota bacterium]PZR63662.1 MAG: cystathionine gamma-synthase [Candidatus Eremiobacter sp. RRmetagenome_bin22]
MEFSTKAIHVGQEADPSTGATIVPIFATSTYTQTSPGVHVGFDYSRTANPTRLALERCLASLENAKYGLCFASGMAATSAVLNLCSAGDHVVVSDDLYGGTFRLFDKVLARYGLTFSYVDQSDVPTVERALHASTRMVWLESPTNPLLKLADIEGIAKMCRRHGTLLAVDNTFATPFLQNPLDLGADLSVHSTTKYISGHSDVVGGFVATNKDALYEIVKFHQNAVGAIPGPFDCFLTLRGAKTLALRMREHERNARAVAAYLDGRPDIERVYYPGLVGHPQHDLAKRQMRGFGGMVSFTPTGGAPRARAIAQSTTVFSLAESLGGVESLICHPVSMTHGSIPKEMRESRGFSDALLRLSVGIEAQADIIADLEQALAATN